MENECGKYHYPSFSKACCLRHLLEMSHFAQMQTLTKKYSKLLLTTLNHAYKEKAFNFSEMQLDLLILLLDVISKFMGHFYMVQKYEYSKLLGIIATKALKETDYKQHPEIIVRECAINNNISCLYEAKEKYSQAYKYICNNKKYIEYNNDFDNAILYNNLIRICLKHKKVEEAKSYVDNLRKCLENAITVLNNIRIKQAFENGNNNKDNDITEFSTKNEIISLMMFNLGITLEKIENDQDARDVYLQGYEFSISSLGEWNFYTQRLKRKIIKTNSKEQLEEKVSLNLASKNSLAQSSSDEEMFTLKGSKSQTLKNSRTNTLDSKAGSGKQFLEDKTLVDKINRICEFVEKYGDMISDEKKREDISNGKHSQSETEPSTSTKIKKEKRQKYSYESFKQMCKPFFLKFFQKGNLLGNNSLQSKSKRTALIAEVLEEFEREKKQERKETVSCPKAKLQTPPIKFNPEASPPQGSKKVPKIKELFSKVISINKQKEEPKGIFAQLANELMESNQEIKKEHIKMKTSENDKVANNVIFDNNNINNDNSSPNATPRIVIPIPNAFIQKHSEAIASTVKNFLKPELEEITKGIRFNIEYENTDETYEFKPFYRKNNAYTKTIKTFAAQKKVNFIKSQKQMQPNFLGSLLLGSKLEVPKSVSKPINKSKEENGSNKIQTQPKKEVTTSKENNDNDEELISITQTNTKLYEFKPYFMSSQDQVQTNPKDKEINQKVTKIAKCLNSSFAMGDDFQITANENQNSPLNITKNLEEAELPNSLLDNNLFTGTNNSQNKNFEEILAPISHSCIDFEDELDTDDNNEFYYNRSKNVVDAYTYFDQLLLSQDSKKFSQKLINYIITLPFQNETYNIVIKNEIIQKRIQFSLYKNESQISITSPINILSVEYTKLNNILQKLDLYNSLPSYYDINNIQTIDDLIRKILIYHTIIINKENQLSVGLSAKPNGINGDKQITFRFLKNQCSVDMLVLSKNTIRIIVSYLKSSQISFCFDCFCDKSSFNTIAQVIKIENSTLANPKEYTSLLAYKFNEEQIGKKGIIPLIMKKIQDVMKTKYSNDEIEGYDASTVTNVKSVNIKNKGKNIKTTETAPNEITLVTVYKSLNELMFKCEIENKGKDIRVLFLHLKPKTNTYSLERYDTTENEVQANATLLNIPIYSLFECSSPIESKLMYERISEREQTLFKYTIMNNYIYNDKKNIKVVQQDNVFSFMFLPKGNEASIVLNFHLNKYIEDVCYIGKLLVYDIVTYKVYSILFFPKNQDKESIENDITLLQRCDKNKMKNILYNLYIDYIQDIPHRTVDTQDLKPLKKFFPLSYILNQCK